MKNVLLPLCLGAGIVGIVWQGCFAETLKSKPAHPALEAVKKKKGEKNQARVTQMTGSLQLSEEQQKAVTDILKKDEEEKYGVIKDAADQLDRISARTEEKIIAELTQDQKQKYSGEEGVSGKEEQDGLLKVFK